MKDQRYPAGKFQMPESIDETVIAQAIAVIRDFPAQVEGLVQNASPEALKRSYREGGWSVYQLIHHVADSHYNAFIRSKLALTEDTPSIKPYREADWAIQEDYAPALMESSLHILKGLHPRWSALFEGLTEAQLQRAYFHPEHQQKVTLLEQLLEYAWHCRHHLEHMRMALDMSGGALQGASALSAP